MADTMVQDVMTHLAVMLYPNETIYEAVRRLARNGISGAPVVEAGKVVGIVSESDLIHALMPPTRHDRGASVLDVLSAIGRAQPRTHHGKKTVADVMSTIVFEVAPASSIWKAASIMERKGIKRLPVVDDDGYLVGIISRADVVKAMARDDEELRAEVIETIGVLGEDTVDGLEVTVDEGVATITGHADRKSTRALALELTSRTPGIVRVIDDLDHANDDSQSKEPPPESGPKDQSLDRHPEEVVHRGAR